QICTDGMDSHSSQLSNVSHSDNKTYRKKNAPLCSLSTNITALPRSVLSRSCELPSRSSLSQVSDLQNKKLYKIKSSYKSFAAIPTNTLLLDQKYE
ncbi:unnamed protein product, partial [Ranitomeya imitator]